MAKKNIKKISLITSGILTPIIVASAVAPLAVVFTNKNNISLNNKDLTSQNYKYLYNNKYYDSIDEIVNETLYESQPISQDIYYGDIKAAIFDQESKRIDINQLRKYNQSKIRPTYINSFGNYEIDFQKAKKSFINQGLIRYFYLDNKGKMHSTEYDAINSNKSNIKVDKLLYYMIEDKNGNKIPINPFNKDDINKFLEIGIENALTGYGNNGFGFEIFREKEKNQYQRDDLSLLLYKSKADIEETLFNAIINVMNEIKNKLLNNLKFNFEISLDDSQAYAYQFIIEKTSKDVGEDNKLLPTIKYQQKDGINNKKTIIFSNISFDDVSLINKFINRKLFEEKSNNWETKISTTKHMLNIVAEEATINLQFANNGPKYKIILDYYGGNGGWAPGNDINIFNWGKGGSVCFKLKLLDPTKTISPNKEYLKNVINENISKFKNQFKLLLNDNNLFEDNLDASFSQLFDEILNNEILNDFKNGNEDSNLDKIIKSLFSDFKEGKEKGEILYATKLEEINFKKTLNFDFSNKLNQKIINNKNKLILTYNGFPVFSFKLSKNNLEFNKHMVNSLFDFTNLYDENKELNPSIINISNSVNKTHLFDINDKNIYLNENTNKFIIPSDIKEYKPILRDDNLKQPISYQNAIWYAMDAYNENLENYINKNNITNVSQSLIKDFLVDPNDFLTLRPNNKTSKNSYGQFEKMYYANYLGLENSFNESVETIKNKLIFNKNDLDVAKNRANKIKPSKIVILYNIAGEVMNPGIKLDDDFVLSTTTDAIYDSENNILDNVLRTLIIEKSQDHFYYENDDGSYSLIKNETNFVFDLIWENKHFYFATFNDAKNYLYEIIKNKTIKVGI